MKMLLRMLVPSLLVALAPSIAQGQSSHAAVYSGANVTWPGSKTNQNQIFVHNGNGMVNAVDTYITGQAIVTKTKGGVNKTTNFAFCTDVGGAQATYTAYYVYYAAYTNVTTKYNIVISTVNPSPEGDPGANIAYTATDGTVVAGNTNAVFLGSYITDPNADIVPFERTGDEVILAFNVGLTAFSLPSLNTVWVNGTWAAGPTKNYVLGLDGTGHAYPVPKDANWAIINVYASSTAVSPAFNIVGVVDPNAAMAAADTTWNPTYAVAVNSAFSSVANRIRVPVDSTGHIYVADPVKPAGAVQDEIETVYVGYVEVIHHLGVF